MPASRRRCMARTGARARSAGFTLVEVLVAFVIVGLTLAVTISTFETGLASVDRAGSHAVALMLAESKLAEIGVTEPLVAGRAEGAFTGTYRWRTIITTMTDPVRAAGSVIAAYRVQVEVTTANAGHPLVHLQTIRLGVAKSVN